MQSNIYQYHPSFYTFYENHIYRVRHPSHPGRGHGSLTCHMTQFERSDWLRAENFINIMIEYTPCHTDASFMVHRFCKELDPKGTGVLHADHVPTVLVTVL